MRIVKYSVECARMLLKSLSFNTSLLLTVTFPLSRCNQTPVKCLSCIIILWYLNWKSRRHTFIYRFILYSIPLILYLSCNSTTCSLIELCSQFKIGKFDSFNFVLFFKIVLTMFPDNFLWILKSVYLSPPAPLKKVQLEFW